MNATAGSGERTFQHSLSGNASSTRISLKELQFSGMSSTLSVDTYRSEKRMLGEGGGTREPQRTRMPQLATRPAHRCTRCT